MNGFSNMCRVCSGANGLINDERFGQGELTVVMDEQFDIGW